MTGDDAPGKAGRAEVSGGSRLGRLLAVVRPGPALRRGYRGQSDSTDDAPTIVMLNDRSKALVELARELANEGRDDAGAVAELVTAANRHRRDLRMARRACQFNGRHHEMGVENLAYRLLDAAISGSPVEPASPLRSRLRPLVGPAAEKSDPILRSRIAAQVAFTHLTRLRTNDQRPDAIFVARVPRANLPMRPRRRETGSGRSVGHPDRQVNLVAFGVGKCPPVWCVRVVDDVPAGGHCGGDTGFDLVVGKVDVDVNPVALRPGFVHLLEGERRSASQRIEYVLVAEHVVPQHRTPERPGRGGHTRVD